MTNLQEALDSYGYCPYLITSSDLGPHTCIVDVTLSDKGLCCAISKTATANARTHPTVSLLWPPGDREGYSIIINADAVVDEVDGVNVALLAITKAVFHRAGSKAPGSKGPCPADCLPIDIAQQVIP